MAGQDNILLEISERLVRVETKLDALNKTDKIAQEALSMSISNKERIDKIDKIIFWAGTTIIGAVFLALLGLVFI